jgi:hypothetical protein
LTWAISVSRASRVRWWYQAELAWWRRRQASQCAAAGGRRGVAEQAPGLWDGERDHPWAGGRGLVWVDRWRCLGAGAAAQQRGGDGADGQGGHDQHGVPGDRGIEADLGLVQPEAALAELEALFYWPAQPSGADQPGHRPHLALGHVTVAVGQLAGGQVAPDEQVVPGGDRGEP